MSSNEIDPDNNMTLDYSHGGGYLLPHKLLPPIWQPKRLPLCIWTMVSYDQTAIPDISGKPIVTLT